MRVLRILPKSLCTVNCVQLFRELCTFYPRSTSPYDISATSFSRRVFAERSL